MKIRVNPSSEFFHSLSRSAQDVASTVIRVGTGVRDIQRFTMIN